MSVLVKGMEMPKTCNKCDFCTYIEKDRDVWCTSTIRIIKRGITRPEYEYQDLPRPDWCPLVEVKTPHGRLIDEAEAKEHFYTCETNGRPFHCMELSERLACFDEISTVIEAEET